VGPRAGVNAMERRFLLPPRASELRFLGLPPYRLVTIPNVLEEFILEKGLISVVCVNLVSHPKERIWTVGG
jgi:hypothetical protein